MCCDGAWACVLMDVLTWCLGECFHGHVWLRYFDVSRDAVRTCAVMDMCFYDVRAVLSWTCAIMEFGRVL